MSNPLANEKSPYLLQHKDNPVEWHPWGEEAFKLAEKEDKPVFLSIGYATCHWCHVMAHESFEDAEVAGLMNEAFVNVKVDREERPDIDNTYMTVCQMLTGKGGWPLTILMTPGKRPFFAATYIPKETHFNRMGMKELVPQISRAWKDERQKISQAADRILKNFTRTLESTPGKQPDTALLKKTAALLKRRFDPDHGGFGEKPKFPSPHNLIFLLQYSHSFKDDETLDMARLTLEKMRLGGMYDHIGFGFHRYSTDSRWLLPHFEKMLYDQAMLMLAYTEGWRRTGDPLLRQTVFEIATYISEQMSSNTGGFYSAEDADSEGEEGKFYVWETDEISDVLNSDEFTLFRQMYNLDPEGNYMDEATGHKTGYNIPYLNKRAEKVAADLGMELDELQQIQELSRKKLKSHRSRRTRPLRDDKILTDWNGLMIAALARAGALLGHDAFYKQALKAWRFLSEVLFGPEGNLLHRYREGDAAIPAMADDYAYLIWGLIELYEATFDLGCLQQALNLNDQFMEDYWDPENGAVFFTGNRGETLLGRQKEIYDGAMPSSNSVTAMNLVRLSRLTGRTELEERAEKLLRTFSSFLDDSPDSATHAMQALMHATGHSAEIVICGPPDHPETKKMISTARKKMNAPYVIHLKTPENASRLSEVAPYTRHFPLQSRPAVYLCRDFSCEAPVDTAEELEKLITG